MKIKSPLQNAADFLSANLVDAAIQIINKSYPGSSRTRKATELLFRCLAQKATNHFNAGEYEPAHTAYLAALELSPGSGEIMADLGASAERLGLIDEAIDWHQKARRSALAA